MNGQTGTLALKNLQRVFETQILQKISLIKSEQPISNPPVEPPFHSCSTCRIYVKIVVKKSILKS